MKQGSDEWLAERRLGVTSTDIAAILGISPWKSEGDVAREKAGAIEEIDDATARRYRLGHALEPVIAAEETVEHGFRLRRVQRFVVDRTNPILRTSLDYERVGERTIVETKSYSPRDGDLPEHIEAQVRWQMGVARYPRAHIATLRFGSTLVCFDVDHDDAVFAGMVVLAEDFWRRYLAGGPFGETKDSTRRAWPIDDGSEMVADENLAATVRQLIDVRTRRKEIESEDDALTTAVQVAMGESTTLVGPSWQVSWKASKPSEVTDYKTQAYDALRALADHDPDAAEVLRTIHTSTRPGSRRFTIKETR